MELKRRFKQMQSGENIEMAARYIKEGKLVAFPTETVYGLGANALNPIAVAKIFELKQRPSFDPLIVHIADRLDLIRLTKNLDERVIKIAEKFWPGPLTLIVPKNDIVPDIVTSGLPTVGIRMPDNDIALELIRLSGCPIAAPSANKFGRISPTNAAHVRKNLPKVDYILEGGKSKVGIESTIISITDRGFRILRSGVITREEIEAIVPYDSSVVDRKDVMAPGMFASHYSPTKPMLIDDGINTPDIDKSKAGFISYSGANTGGYRKVLRLTYAADLREYAANLFEAMHLLEDSDVEIIVAEQVPETGLGIAIMDRLRKAANVGK